MTIDDLKSKIESFLGDYNLEVFESDGQKLFDMPNEISRKFVTEFANEIRKILYNDDSALENEDFVVIQKILIQAQTVKSKYEKAEIAVKKTAEKIKANKIELLKPEEMEEGLKLVLNNNTFANEFYSDSEVIYQALIQTYCTNAAINSGIFKAGQDVSVEEIQTSHPRIAQHAKKTAFDQMCLLVFGHHPEQYDIMRKVEEIDSNHKANQLMEHKVKKNQIVFAYIDMQPLSLPKFPRFASILSSHEGVGCPVEDVIHQHKTLTIQCVIAGQEINVKVSVWYGLIITKMETGANKPLDLQEILNQSAEVAKNSPELSLQNTRVKEDQELASSYLSTFEQLATSTNVSYNQVVSQLKKKAGLNAPR